MSNDANHPDDELDAQLRGAMAALDRATPAAMFDGLLDRALSRIEDPSIGELPLHVEDDHDDPRDNSGLKDIRALASETKARLSSRRSSQDLSREAAELSSAASSSSWKSVAMPAPARVVELPPPVVAAPVAAAPAVVAQQPPRRRIRPWVGGLGVALAAAAGAVIVVTLHGTASDRAPSGSSSEAAAPVAQAPKAVPPAPVVVATPPVGAYQAAEPSPAHDGIVSMAGKSGRSATPPPTKGVKGSKKPISAGYVADPPADPEPPVTGKLGSSAGSGSATELDPVQVAVHAPEPRPPAKPGLGRGSLSPDDIKRGMTAVEPRAKACFAGTAGLANVRLSVAPSGQVDKVTVTGPFAGSQVGACVERAVRAAAFPAWDGAPQSFNYSYLLSD